MPSNLTVWIVLAATLVAAQEPAVRQLPRLEQFAVTHCEDQRFFWITQSAADQRALFTPEFYKKCTRGSHVTPLFPCCGTTGYSLFYTREQLEKQLAGTDVPRSWIDAYLRAVDDAVDFDEEVLVLIGTAYGGTGMARRSVSFRREGSTLTATVRVVLPPPPLTPDTAFFRTAFTVNKSKIRRVEIVTEYPRQTVKAEPFTISP